MTAITICVISYAYSNLIEFFPGGGGGYLVATKLLGNKVASFRAARSWWTMS
jgi:amino acid transporter